MTIPERGRELDLHGLAPPAALRRLGQELHAARVQGASRILVITGRGWGNRLQEAKLRPIVESWLRGPEGTRAGVTSATRVQKGGALLVELRRGSPRRP